MRAGTCRSWLAHCLRHHPDEASLGRAHEMEATSAMPSEHLIPVRQKRSGTGMLWSADVTFFVLLLSIIVITGYVGLVSPIRIFAGDTFFFLDNAYRVAQGQVPHRDFSSAWGPLMFLIDAAGLGLSMMKPDGLGYANALFGGLIAVWAYLIVRTRWQAVYSYIIGLYTALLIMAPFALGENLANFTLAMTYNRYGYALFGVLLVECASEMLLQSGTRRRSLTGATSTGVVLGLLVFLKISYAMVAVPVIAACMVGVSYGRLRRLSGIGAGFLAVTIAMAVYLRFDLRDMVQDIAMAADARRLALQPSSLMHLVVAAQNAPLLVLALLVELGDKAGLRDLSAHGRVARLTLLTVGAGCLLLISNQQNSNFPLNAYLAVVILATVAAKRAAEGKSRWLVGSLLVWLCCLPLALQNASSLALAALTRASQDPTSHLVLNGSTWGKNIIFAPVVGDLKTATDGEEYVAALNDGLDLLARRVGTDGGVLVFDMFNPFNYLLGRASPKGGFAAAAYKYVFSDASHPCAERFFGTTNYVLVPKYPDAALNRPAEGSDGAGLTRLYGSELKRRFRVVEKSSHWVLWRRLNELGRVSSSMSMRTGSSLRHDG